jgi:LmbE family N-acetylglucosaminyl deacetylase
MKETVMVIAAHADDEALGCGGTMARLAAEGAQINVVFMADGVHSRKSSSQNHLKLRREAAEKAQKILRSERCHFLNLPDNQMDQVPFLKIVQKLEALIEKYKPKVIFTHFHGDLNVDHRITQQAVMTACRPLPGCPVKKIYGFEVPSSTEWATPGKEPFSPTFFVDIGPFVEKKKKALEAYSMEMREKPHARSMNHVEALARHRGNSTGVEAAEAFVVYRHIQ